MAQTRTGNGGTASARSAADRRSAPNGTGRNRAVRETKRVGNQTARQTKRVASGTAEEGRQVATRAARQSRRVATQARDEGAQVASRGVARAREVTRSAAEDGRELVGTVKEQATVVTDELSTQGRNVLEEAQTQLETQAQLQTRRLADALQRLGDEADALADGRPEEAETLADYAARAADTLRQGADRLAEVGEDIEDRGIGAVLEDVQDYARRRPGAFLLGALVAGFGVGRVVQSGRATDNGSR